MATTAQEDPRDAILAYLADQVSLTADARQMLRGLLQEVDPRTLQRPADLAQAYASMDRLVEHLGGRYGAESIDARMLQLSLRDLCPLFPIC